jgi:hypothetical protein
VQVRCLFTLLDEDQNGLIDEAEFFNVCDTLFLTVTVVEDSAESPARMNVQTLLGSNIYGMVVVGVIVIDSRWC